MRHNPDKDLIVELLSRKVRGKLSEGETEVLDRWVKESEENAAFYERILDSNQLGYDLYLMQKVDTESALNLARAKIKANQTVIRLQKRRNYVKWGAAAAVLIIIGFLSYFHYHGSVDIKSILSENKSDSTANRLVTLTLPNGKTLELPITKDGIVMAEGAVEYQDGSSIDVEGDFLQGPFSKKEKAYLTLTTPKGGRFQIVLSDGTTVWLNANSTLKYPAQFEEGERRVELDGEAFFDVTHMRKVNQYFIVQSKWQEVKVLGTQFNINAYADEPYNRTTLIDGKVLVTSDIKDAEGPEIVLSKAGQQARVMGKSFQMTQVNAEHIVAWKNNRMQFDELDVYSIMRTLKRIYPIEVHYASDLRGIKLGGSISNDKSIEEVLKVLEVTGEVRFKVEPLANQESGRRVTVMR